MRRKLIVIGLDGATWDLLTPWIKQGHLPNFKKILDDGVYGPLKSCYPYVTWPAWKCYSTGKNPGKLGVYWWAGLDTKNKKATFYDSSSFNSLEYWDYLSKHGGKVGIINMPTTFPPKPVNGFMIAYGMGGVESDFTYPRELKDELVKEFNYFMHPRNFVSEDKDEYLREVYKLIDLTFNVLECKLDEVDVLHASIFYTDQVQHYFWTDMVEGQTPYQKVIENVWIKIDNHIGKLFAKYPDHNFMFMSDHGFGPLKGCFNLNSWLKKEKYLKTRSTIGEIFYGFGLNRNRLYRLGQKTGLLNIAKKLFSKEFRNSIPKEGGRIERNAIQRKINWEQSRIIAFGEGLIYFRYGLSDYDKGKLSEELITKLKKIRHPKTGENIIRDVLRKKDIYSGPYLDWAPDMVIDCYDGYEIVSNIFEGEIKDMDYNAWTANHRLHGIFACYGPDFKHGAKVDEAEIYDLAPTILHLLDVPIPDNFDGKVLKEVFSSESPAYKRNISYQRVNAETEDLREPKDTNEAEIVDRLKALGYF